jgi:hypothetical protein
LAKGHAPTPSRDPSWALQTSPAPSSPLQLMCPPWFVPFPAITDLYGLASDPAPGVWPHEQPCWAEPGAPGCWPPARTLGPEQALDLGSRLPASTILRCVDEDGPAGDKEKLLSSQPLVTLLSPQLPSQWQEVEQKWSLALALLLQGPRQSPSTFQCGWTESVIQVTALSTSQASANPFVPHGPHLSPVLRTSLASDSLLSV